MSFNTNSLVVSQLGIFVLTQVSSGPDVTQVNDLQNNQVYQIAGLPAAVAALLDVSGAGLKAAQLTDSLGRSQVWGMNGIRLLLTPAADPANTLVYNLARADVGGQVQEVLASDVATTRAAIVASLVVGA